MEGLISRLHRFAGKISMQRHGVDEEKFKVGGHHPKEDFSFRGKEPKEEVQIYTWKDATLRELIDLKDENNTSQADGDASRDIISKGPLKDEPPGWDGQTQLS
ncbi:hypothetical protein HPP92_028558, partial [Vanilla planifolia]